MATSTSKDEMLMEAVEKIAKDENDSGFKQWVEQKLEGSGTLKILSTGKTGSGKSTLLNGLVGSEFVVGHKLDAQTAGVEKHSHQIGNLKVIAWDSPGLQDKTNEEDYLKAMEKETDKEGGIDLLFYCIRMDETRSDLNKHFSAIRTITNAFGHEIWENALIVLTFANMYEYRLQITMGPKDLQEKFNEKVQEWKEKVVAELVEMKVDKAITDKVPIQPAGFHRQLHLPGYDHWLSLLWARTFAAVKDSSKPILLAVNMERFTTKDKVPEKTAEKKLENQPIVTTPTFKEVILGALKEKRLELAGSVGGGTIVTGIGYGLGATLTTATGVGVGVGFVLTAIVLYHQYKKQKEEKQKKNA